MRSKLILTFALPVSIALCVLSVPASLFKEQNEKTPLKTEQERNLYQFAMMIDCATNRSAWEYSDYGCWCGYGGSGTPVDEADRCCYKHDYCYDYLVKNNICSNWWLPYSAIYLYTGCHKCEPESSYPSDDPDAACKKALCKCDSEAAECFAKASFNAANIDYDTSKC